MSQRTIGVGIHDGPSAQARDSAFVRALNLINEQYRAGNLSTPEAAALVSAANRAYQNGRAAELEAELLAVVDNGLRRAFESAGIKLAPRRRR